jgi:hypothetical protein
MDHCYHLIAIFYRRYNRAKGVITQLGSRAIEKRLAQYADDEARWKLVVNCARARGEDLSEARMKVMSKRLEEMNPFSDF